MHEHYASGPVVFEGLRPGVGRTEVDSGVNSVRSAIFELISVLKDGLEIDDRMIERLKGFADNYARLPAVMKKRMSLAGVVAVLLKNSGANLKLVMSGAEDPVLAGITSDGHLFIVERALKRANGDEWPSASSSLEDEHLRGKFLAIRGNYINPEVMKSFYMVTGEEMYRISNVDRWESTTYDKSDHSSRTRVKQHAVVYYDSKTYRKGALLK